MINYFKSVADGLVIGIGETSADGNITKEEYKELTEIFKTRPDAPLGYVYKLKDDTHEWVLTEAGGGL